MHMASVWGKEWAAPGCTVQCTDATEGGAPSHRSGEDHIKKIKGSNHEQSPYRCQALNNKEREEHIKDEKNILKVYEVVEKLRKKKGTDHRCWETRVCRTFKNRAANGHTVILQWWKGPHKGEFLLYRNLVGMLEATHRK